ncbi:uncharacterized protein SPPG_07984 [Spizellomyces punctatus DAOM BR117]|uniref:PH domain-containing protein n=1 Tax=Spizellomyces punctatus (strain DAOM BR117) TaxID=645134 RepID=A0A0L0H7A6_SPIPD|nr:uncharacterized protein SPPG_07984 [Spizellomyces punctatus DAOM BR117]KNC96776.1 hypothetical protein SPPG_07984 [Spizellomyces punctatus DAOM BR117]|eukprot:XP_016604816.1 hypothetical protein SPPG_07984 [Spizellomyces punctatus DAOM BR117]
MGRTLEWTSRTTMTNSTHSVNMLQHEALSDKPGDETGSTEPETGLVVPKGNMRREVSCYSLLSAYQAGSSGGEEEEDEKDAVLPLTEYPPPRLLRTVKNTNGSRAHLQSLYATLEEVMAVKARLNRTSTMAWSADDITSRSSSTGMASNSSGSTLFEDGEHPAVPASMDTLWSDDTNEKKLISILNDERSIGWSPAVHPRLGPLPKPPPRSPLPVSPTSSLPTPPHSPLSRNLSPPPPPPVSPPTDSDQENLVFDSRPNVANTKALKTLGILSSKEADAANGAVQGNSKAFKMLGISADDAMSTAGSQSGPSSPTGFRALALRLSKNEAQKARRAISTGTLQSPSEPNALPALHTITRLFSGPLHKLYPAAVFRPWKRRHGVLAPGRIYIFKSDSMHERAVDCLPVQVDTEVTTGLGGEMDKKGGFTVRTGSRTWFLAVDHADVEIGLERWIKAIKDAVLREKFSVATLPPPPPQYEDVLSDEEEQDLPQLPEIRSIVPTPVRITSIPTSPTSPLSSDSQLFRSDSGVSTLSYHKRPPPHYRGSMGPPPPMPLPEVPPAFYRLSVLSSTSSHASSGSQLPEQIDEAIKTLDHLLEDGIQAAGRGTFGRDGKRLQSVVG